MVNYFSNFKTCRYTSKTNKPFVNSSIAFKLKASLGKEKMIYEEIE